MKLRYFDLETGALPREELEHLVPTFHAPTNYKDPDKIAAKIEEQREKWFASAALQATTGQIVAAVLVDEMSNCTVLDADEIGEHTLLLALGNWMTEARMGAAHKIAGYNLFDFDLPWFVQRCFALDVPLPHGLISFQGRWPQWAPWIIDLRAIWTVGDRRGKGKLGEVAQTLGVGSKELDGADFAERWRDPSRHAEALAYLINDGLLLPRIAERMLAVGTPALFGRGMGQRAGTVEDANHLSDDDGEENGNPDA